ncbi:MAG: hypothetical protein Q4D26_02540 [Clostridia bacterium]|nr:hypothetical protein [Clostridia bacterium]
MKSIVKYLFTVFIILFLIVLYVLKLTAMGMDIKNIIVFILMFFSASVICYGIVRLFNGGIRKKLDKELNSGESYSDE